MRTSHRIDTAGHGPATRSRHSGKRNPISDADILSPVDHLVVQFPQTDGSALPLPYDLVARGIIAVPDLAFVRQDTDGSLGGVDVSEIGLADDIDVILFAGAATCLVDDTDVGEAGADLGCSAAIVVYENTRAAPFAATVRPNGTRLVASLEVLEDQT